MPNNENNVGVDNDGVQGPRGANVLEDIPERVQLAAEPSPLARLAAVRAAKNPLLEAAQPMLRALADMPVTLATDKVEVFHSLLSREVMSFQSVCTNAQIKHENIVAASYALCTAIDESANSTTWGGAVNGDVGVWAGKQLAMDFHQDNKGGDKFFLLVGRLAANHQEHIDLLEVMYFILGLGFEGRYGGAGGGNGRRQLETIRHRLYTILAATYGDVAAELSPHWKGMGAGNFRLLRSIPVWITVTLLALVLLGLFSWYKYQLYHASVEVEERIRAIGAMQPPPPPPPPPVYKSLRLKELLSAEIASGTVSVEEDDNHSAVSFKGDDMFVPGQARMNPNILPVIAKVANEINEVSGSVQVTGHSDNQPIRTREFPDNQVLSKKRAAAVAEVLESNGVASIRLTVEGRGDTMPIADNATPVGRSKNRRVDIVVTQGGIATYSASVHTSTAIANTTVKVQPTASAAGR